MMTRWFSLALPLFLACASGTPRAAEPQPPAWSSESRSDAARLAAHLDTLSAPPANAVTVRLAFAPEADLDLYVSDPQLETVYYGNTPVRSGGQLTRDFHCKSQGRDVRVEEIVFAEPLLGRYRIGVDYAHRCERAAGDVAYVIEIHQVGERQEIRGISEPRVFSPIVAEIEVRP